MDLDANLTILTFNEYLYCYGSSTNNKEISMSKVLIVEAVDFTSRIHSGFLQGRRYFAQKTSILLSHLKLNFMLHYYLQIFGEK